MIGSNGGIDNWNPRSFFEGPTCDVSCGTPEPVATRAVRKLAITTNARLPCPPPPRNTAQTQTQTRTPTDTQGLSIQSEQQHNIDVLGPPTLAAFLSLDDTHPTATPNSLRMRCWTTSHEYIPDATATLMSKFYEAIRARGLYTLVTPFLRHSR